MSYIQMANLVPPIYNAMQKPAFFFINTAYVTYVNTWNWALKKVLENGKRPWKSPGISSAEMCGNPVCVTTHVNGSTPRHWLLCMC